MTYDFAFAIAGKEKKEGLTVAKVIIEAYYG
jgi:hypothetical protein